MNIFGGKKRFNWSNPVEEVTERNNGRDSIADWMRFGELVPWKGEYPDSLTGCLRVKPEFKALDTNEETLSL